MKTTRPLLCRTLVGIGISLSATIALAVFLVPGGAFDGRAASLRIDAPELPTATPPPANPVDEEPVVTTTTTAPSPAAPAIAPATISRALVIAPSAPPMAKQGHYACTGDNSATVDCVNDEVGPIHVDVNPGSDQPIGTLGEKDPAYGTRLTAELCEVKPEFC